MITKLSVFLLATVPLLLLSCENLTNAEDNGEVSGGGAAASGAAFGHMTVTYSSGNDTEGYETDLLLFADAETDDAVRNTSEDVTEIDLLHLDFSEASAGADLDTGRYTVATYGSTRQAMTVAEVDIARGFYHINNRTSRGGGVDGFQRIGVRLGPVL